MIHELTKLLDMPDDDRWYDDGCEMARKFVDKNSKDIFDELLNVWETWPASRQEHLAYILGEGDLNSEKVLIEKMIESPNLDVAFRAKESRVDFSRKP